MSDDIKIGLDGGPLQEAAKPALDALKQLRAAVDRLDEANLDRLNKETRGLITTLKTLASSTSSDMQKFVTGVTSAVDRAGKEATGKAKVAGNAIGKQFAVSVEEEVSKAKIRISAPRLSFANGLSGAVSGKGLDSIQDVLAETSRVMSATGARMTSQIQVEQAAMREAQKVANDTYRSRLAWQKSIDKASSDGAKAQAADLAQAQKQSNETYRSRVSYARSLATEQRTAARAEQADANRTYQLGQNYYRSSQAEQRRSAAQEQVDANRTYAFRTRMMKSEQAQRAAVESARNRGTDQDARFQAASRVTQLRRATIVSNALDGGMGSEEAVRRYGAAAVAASADLGRLRDAHDQLNAKQLAARGSAAQLAAESKLLAANQREVHSAMRGVAGAANALFLTYGSLIPLTTAFLAASSVKEAIKDYKDLEYQIKFVKALEEGGMGMSEASVRGQLGATAANAGYDPLEAAKGMRLLAQSGLDAREALTALPTVLKVATVGELGVANATETLTGAVHAFGLELSDMERVGDVLAKAGAISNTSVDRMAESMKQASTVAEQFHLSIEDASTAMVVLAKRNIVGSAAGTSLTNMMRDLANPHGRAKKAADSIKFDAFDTNTGQTKDLFAQILPELRAKLADFAPKAQKQLIADLTNNRGEKLLAALLGTTDQDLAEIKQKLGDSKGFVTKANEELMDSVEGDLKRLRATLDSSLAEAGAAGSAQLRGALQELKDVVASPEFIGAVSTLVQGFTSLVTIAVKAIDLLTGPAGYAAGILSLGATAGPVLSVVGKIFPIATQAATALGTIGMAAGGAAGGAATLLGTLARFGAVGLTVAAAGTALYVLYGALTNKGTYDTAAANIDTIIKKQESYYVTLVKSNNELAKQLGLQSVDKAGDNSAKSNYSDARAKYDKDWGAFDIVDARSRLSAARGQPGFVQKGFNNLDGQVKRYDEATQNLEMVRQKATKSIGLEYATEQEQKRQRQLQVDQASQHARAIQASLATGTRDYKSGADRGADAAARRAANEDYKNEKKALDLKLAGQRLEADAVDESTRVRLSALETSYDRGLTDFKSYQAQMTAIQGEQSAARLKVAQAERDVVAQGLSDLRAKAAARSKAGLPDTGDALKNDITSSEQDLQKADLQVSKLLADQAIARAKALTDLVKPTSETLKNEEKEGAIAQERIRQEIEKARVKGSGIELSERELFIQTETLRILGEQERKLADKERLLREQIAAGAFDSPGTAPLRAKLEDQIAGGRLFFDASSGQLRGALGDEFDGKKWQDTAKRLASTMEGSIKDALTAGLTGDATALTNFGKTLQKTVMGALVDAFYDAFVGDAVKGLARDLMNSLRSAAGGGGSNSGGGGLLGSLGTIGSLVAGFFGGGSSITSTIGIGTGAAAASAIGGYGAGVANIASLLPPFDGGGFTGVGGKYAPKGVVHGGEFVINKESTSKLGLGFLNSLNQYAEGGFVPLTAGPSMTSNPAGRVSAAAGPSIVFSPQTSIQVDSRSDRAAVIQDVQRVVTENQRQYTEQLKRLKVLPA